MYVPRRMAVLGSQGGVCLSPNNVSEVVCQHGFQKLASNFTA